jgi:hypothetical protein
MPYKITYEPLNRIRGVTPKTFERETATEAWKEVDGLTRSEFSKKFENHVHMVALYTVWYNFVKQHKSLKGLAPAMAAGVSKTLWSVEDIANLVEAAAPAPAKRGPYKPRAARISN